MNHASTVASIHHHSDIPPNSDDWPLLNHLSVGYPLTPCSAAVSGFSCHHQPKSGISESLRVHRWQKPHTVASIFTSLRLVSSVSSWAALAYSGYSWCDRQKMLQWQAFIDIKSYLEMLAVTAPRRIYCAVQRRQSVGVVSSKDDAATNRTQQEGTRWSR